MRDDAGAEKRTAARIREGVLPPPLPDTDDVGELLIPYCLGETDPEQSARVIRALCADPSLLDQLAALRVALRAAGVEPEGDRHASAPGVAENGRARTGSGAAPPPTAVIRLPDAIYPPAPADALPRGGRGGAARRRWYAAALVTALAAALAALLLARPTPRQGDAPVAVRDTVGALAPVAPVPAPPVGVNRQDAEPREAGPPPPGTAPLPPSPALPEVPGAPGAALPSPRPDVAAQPLPGPPFPAPRLPPRPAPPSGTVGSAAFTLAALEGRDSVEVRPGDSGALARLVAASLPPELARDPELRVLLVVEEPGVTRGGAPGAPGAPGDGARRVRVVVRSTTGPCVGPDAAVVSPATDLRPLLQRSAAEFRRCAGPPLPP
jgi:hypothetical protein